MVFFFFFFFSLVEEVVVVVFGETIRSAIAIEELL
jgi:hypothetical protein